jgi:hypothetical protein
LQHGDRSTTIHEEHTMTPSRTLIALAGVVGIGVVATGIALAVDDDPSPTVDSVTLADIGGLVDDPPSTPPADRPDDTLADVPASTATIPAAPVEGLRELVGVLRADPDGDADDWYVSGVDLDVGPEGWVLATTSPADFDGDGRIGTVFEELRGLEGSDVTLGVRFDRSDDDLDDAAVFTINGATFRDPTQPLAPWQQAAAGDDASPEAIAAAALAAVGTGSTVLDVDPETDDGFVGWEVEVRSADGRRYEVLVTRDGRAVDVRPYED